MNRITMNPIGIIYSPYKESKDVPIQGRFKEDIEAYLELKNRFIPGLKDLDEFSHCMLIYYLHKSKRETITGKPFLEDTIHGIFAIRSPHRPNHIGLSVVKIKRIKDNRLYFTGVDMINETPLLDIKPYIKHFDDREEVKSGWLDKHFKNGKIPDRVFKK